MQFLSIYTIIYKKGKQYIIKKVKNKRLGYKSNIMQSVKQC